jgi:hypothetical protein
MRLKPTSASDTNHELLGILLKGSRPSATFFLASYSSGKSIASLFLQFAIWKMTPYARKETRKNQIEATDGQVSKFPKKI